MDRPVIDDVLVDGLARDLCNEDNRMLWAASCGVTRAGEVELN
jgi:hypothetical protein